MMIYRYLTLMYIEKDESLGVILYAELDCTFLIDFRTFLVDFRTFLVDFRTFWLIFVLFWLIFVLF